MAATGEWKQPIKIICQYHLTLGLASLSHINTHTQRIIQCTPGNDSPSTDTQTHTHCWKGKSIISPSSTDCCPSKLCYIDLKKFSAWLSVTGITASWLRWEQTVPVQPLYPSRWADLLLGLSDTRISQQPSNTAVEAPLTLREQVPILLGKGDGISMIYLFIHEKAQTRTNLVECVSLFGGRSWMNKQKQREISCLGLAPTGVSGVRSISLA